MSVIKNSIAIINSRAPFSKSNGKDALDIALIFGSYEQATSLFFQGDGVYQLICDQNAELINTKDYLKTFAALEFYDIENIYVCQKSLQQRKLDGKFHINNVQILSSMSFAEKLAQHKTILRF